ncbi:hypothetical protein WIMU106979_24500 [Williamsia muralis]
MWSFLAAPRFAEPRYIGLMQRPSELCDQLANLRRPGSASLLIRVDFTDDDSWERVRDMVTAGVPQPGGVEFRPDVRVVDDERFDGLDPTVLIEGNDQLRLGVVAFFVDARALRSPFPVLAVDLRAGNTVRVHPDHVWLIENNVSGGVGFATLIEGRVDGDVFRPGVAPPAFRTRTPQTAAGQTRKPGPRRRVTGEPAARPKSFTERRQDRRARLRESLGGDEELDRIAQIAPEIAQLNELDPSLVKAVLRLSREEQQRIAQWSLQQALDRAGIADDPDVIEAITSPREEWYATHSTKELAYKFVDHPPPEDSGPFSERTAGPYGPPRNAAMAAVSAIAGAAFPVPDISVVRALHAACTTFGRQAPDLMRQLREHFDIGGTEDSE